MQNNPIGWIEIPVTDLDRAEKFYSEYFGVQLDRQEGRYGVQMSWFPMDMESYGSATTLIQGPEHRPSADGTLVYFSAPDGSVEKGLQKAEDMGVTVLVPKRDVGEHGFYAVLQDSEGNRIAIHSMNE